MARFHCRIGLRSYELLSIMVNQKKDCDCSGIQVRRIGTPVLLFQDTVMESREQFRSMFDRLRLERIEKNEQWWPQSRANQCLRGQEFLKCPFVVDRTLEWFQHQVRSGTLHTQQVTQELYGAKGKSNLCSHCMWEPESILH